MDRYESKSYTVHVFLDVQQNYNSLELKNVTGNHISWHLYYVLQDI
jgi:hypothetical protein